MILFYAKTIYENKRGATAHTHLLHIYNRIDPHILFYNTCYGFAILLCTICRDMFTKIGIVAVDINGNGDGCGGGALLVRYNGNGGLHSLY